MMGAPSKLIQSHKGFPNRIKFCKFKELFNSDKLKIGKEDLGLTGKFKMINKTASEDIRMEFSNIFWGDFLIVLWKNLI